LGEPLLRIEISYPTSPLLASSQTVILVLESAAVGVDVVGVLPPLVELDEELLELVDELLELVEDELLELDDELLELEDDDELLELEDDELLELEDEELLELEDELLELPAEKSEESEDCALIFNCGAANTTSKKRIKNNLVLEIFILFMIHLQN